jgi:hypothetical protein
MAGQRLQGIGCRQRGEVLHVELRAQGEVLGVGEGALLPGDGDAPRGFFLQAADQAQAEADGWG